MKSEEFIAKNAMTHSLWDGYEGRLIASADAREAAKMAYNEALTEASALVEKYAGISIQLADILQREIANKVK